MSDVITARPRRAYDRDGAVRVTADVEGAEPLWFSVEREHEALLGDRSDHVAVALLLPAMRYGRDLRVGGVVTDSLLHRLNRDVQGLVRAVHPQYRTVAVTADEVAPAAAPAPGVVTGFSGGVDSFATVMEYGSAADVPPDLRLSHLVNNNVGAHGDGGRVLWRLRHEALRPVADELGLPLVLVDSNMDAHYPRMGFMQTVTFRNAAAVHLLGGGIGRSYHASEGTYRNIRMPPPHGDIGLAGAMTFPLLSTPALTLESTSSAMSRIERTLALIGAPYAERLDVCIDTDPHRSTNCSQCWKCMRTMLTLEIAGHLDEFVPQAFLRAPYEARRSAYYVELMASDEPNDVELVEFGDENGWDWGRTTRGWASTVRAKNALIGSARRARRSIRAARTARRPENT